MPLLELHVELYYGYNTIYYPIIQEVGVNVSSSFLDCIYYKYEEDGLQWVCYGGRRIINRK